MTLTTDPDASPRQLEPNEIIRSPIWYRDGSVVLQAEHTQFCVHEGVLSQHSVVFRDMFKESPNTGDVNELLDGRPLIHLAEDSARDVTLLLKALYDPTILSGEKLYWPQESEQTFMLLSAVLRVSTKYLIRNLRSAVETIFTSEIPHAVFVWDYQVEYNLGRRTSQPDSNSVYLFGFRERSVGWKLELANLFEEAQLLRALPLALYNWIGFTPREIFLSGLTQKNKERLLHALPRLGSELRQSFRNAQVEDTPDRECHSPVACRDISVRGAEDQLTADLSRSYHPLSAEMIWSPAVCEPCQKRRKAYWHEQRDRALYELPGHCMLGTWRELQQKDKKFVEAFTLDPA